MQHPLLERRTNVSDVIVKMQDISKSFGGIKALDHVQIELRRGEVHALMGENGAGKSTLMKIMTGVYTKDSGTMYLYNEQTKELEEIWGRFYLPGYPGTWTYQ